MRIVYLAAEVAPFSKVGGLADVAAGLPKALAGLGHDVRVVTPLHRGIDRSRLERCGTVTPRLDGQAQPVALHAIETLRAGSGRVVVYFCDHEWFAASDVYGGEDEPHRFALLSRAALQLSGTIGPAPDILHANDWHTALAVAELAAGRSAWPALAATGGVLTIHNVAYQGVVDARFLDWLGPPAGSGPASEAGANLLGWGIAAADVVTTVSPTYAREIVTNGMGLGLEKVLRRRRGGVIGILNGIDSDRFDPARDPALAASFDADHQAGRAACRSALRDELGLTAPAPQPILGMVARLHPQKGVDLVADAVDDVIGMGGSLVLLGSGDPPLEARLAGLGRLHPGRVAVRIGFDAALAQRIYAGSDMFLIPSRFEPCGLAQLIAMRYGSVPIGRRTGGLVDTIHDGETGFLFDEPTRAGLLDGVKRAVGAWRDQERWAGLRTRCMRQDHSWAASAPAYVDAYQLAATAR
jgi:starch synthase